MKKETSWGTEWLDLFELEFGIIFFPCWKKQIFFSFSVLLVGIYIQDNPRLLKRDPSKVPEKPWRSLLGPKIPFMFNFTGHLAISSLL